jgi:metal-responsive CopG/Arc/MetJ family transcriptional regulator
MALTKINTEGQKELTRFGVYFPRDTVQRLDELKGYHSRNKFMQKIVEEYLNANTKQQQMMEASK